MRNVGFLLIGFSLLILALGMIILEVAKAIFITVNFNGDITPNFAYSLTVIVFLFGLVLVFLDKRK